MRNIRCYIFLLTLTVIAALPVSAVNYDQKIIEYLNDALNKPNNYTNNSYMPLFLYLKSQQKNPSFQAYLRAKHIKMSLNDQQDYHQVQLYREKQHFCKLALYPLLSDRVATVASFYSLEDPEFLTLPEALSDYYKKLFDQTQTEIQQENREAGEVMKTVAPEKLGELMPGFQNGTVWLVSPERGILADVDSLRCTTWVECGQLQIDLQFKNRLKGALFAFCSGKGEGIPNILFPQVSPRQIPPGLTRRGIVTAPIAPRSTIVYIASIDNTYSNFSLLWDWKSKRMLYFDMALGYSLGNETEHLTRNYLLEYKNRFYFLRNTDNLTYSELVYFGNRYIERDPLADFRAMEL